MNEEVQWQWVFEVHGGQSEIVLAVYDDLNKAKEACTKKQAESGFLVKFDYHDTKTTLCRLYSGDIVFTIKQRELNRWGK